MTRRLVSALIALVAIICTRAALAEPSLVVWHAYREAEERALDGLLARFRAEHPGVVVESLAIPFEAYASKLEAAIPHGHGPDVFIDAHERLGDYRDRGLVAPIDPALVEPGAYDAAALSAVSLDGKPYALPLALKCLALYLRADTPPPASLDRLLIGPGIRLAYEASGAYTHAPILHAFGGKILDDAGRYAFADGPAVDSLTWVAAAVSRGAIPEEASGALITQLFSTNVNAAISGPWLAADLPKDLEYRVVPIPAVHDGGPMPRPFLTVEGAMVAPRPRNSKQTRPAPSNRRPIRGSRWCSTG
jgi:arabinogalactan oligomer/maltooligosaccharide transport system permease protein